MAASSRRGGARRTGILPRALGARRARLPARTSRLARAARAYRRPMVRTGRGQAAVESVGVTVAIALLVAALAALDGAATSARRRAPGRDRPRRRPPRRSRRRGSSRRGRAATCPRGSTPPPAAAATAPSAVPRAAWAMAWRRPACLVGEGDRGFQEGLQRRLRGAASGDPPRSPGQARRPARSRAPHAGGSPSGCIQRVGRPGRLRPRCSGACRRATPRAGSGATWARARPTSRVDARRGRPAPAHRARRSAAACAGRRRRATGPRARRPRDASRRPSRHTRVSRRAAAAPDASPGGLVHDDTGSGTMGYVMAAWLHARAPRRARLGAARASRPRAGHGRVRRRGGDGDPADRRRRGRGEGLGAGLGGDLRKAIGEAIKKASGGL